MKTALLMALVCSAATAHAAGEPARGAAIVASRSVGLCVLCHAVPGVPEALQGTLAPPLAGAGERWDAAMLRRRLLEPERFNPETIMPSYGRSDDLLRVAAERRGKPLLTPAQIEDVVAYLASLK